MDDPWDWEIEWDEGVIVVSELETLELLTLYEEQGQILLDLGEILAPKTQEGRDAHSLYGACKIELVQRGIL